MSFNHRLARIITRTVPLIIACIALLNASCSKPHEAVLYNGSLSAVDVTTCTDDEFTFSVTGDNRDFPGFVGVLNQIKEKCGSGDMFHVTVGDCDPIDMTCAHVEQVFGPDLLTVVAVGNHDIGSELRKKLFWYHDYFEKVFEGAVNPGPECCEDTTFSWDTGPVHFVVINEYFWNGDDEAGVGDVPDPLYNWLASDLENTNQPFVIVFGHEPAFPFYRHVGDSLDLFPENRDRFWALLEQHDVAAYICGHTHYVSVYQHDGGNVWQIDVSNARTVAEDPEAAFLNVKVSADCLQFDYWRDSNVDGDFVLWKTWQVQPRP